MIGLVLVTHGRIGEEMLATLVHVLGEQEQVVAVEVRARDALQKKEQEIVDAIKSVRDPLGRDGVLIMTDMVGGTPSNLASRQMRGGEIAVVTGLNMPMLVTAARARARSSLDRLARTSIEAGRKYIDFAPGSGARGTGAVRDG